jgi:hypothetical protein
VIAKLGFVFNGTMTRRWSLQEAQPYLYIELSFHEPISLLLGEEITT